MTRRGPVPGTTGRPAAEVARICIDAYANGRNMAQQVATEYGCSLMAARSAVSRARCAGHPIPYDYGYTDPAGQWHQASNGHDPRWVANVTRARKIAAARRAANQPKPAPVQRPRAQRKFTAPRPTGRPHACADCGHQAATGWELAAHTLDAHGRTLVAAERAPREDAA